MEAQDDRQNTPAHDSTLDELVLECVALVEQDGEAALDAACAKHPEHAAKLRRRIELLLQAGLLTSEDSSAVSFPEQLGDFRLLRRLGGGGMGVVYRAEQRSLGREVALKLIRPEHMYFPGARARFAREARAIARLAHPGIAPVHTIGEEHGIPFIAMELVGGASLSALLARLATQDDERLSGSELLGAVVELSQVEATSADRGAMPFCGTWVEACAWVAREIAQALEHAHQRGVVHRDIKPSNVMLTCGGRVLLVDFGLASMQGADAVSRSGSMLGSLPYMAPEQVRGRGDLIGARADVYGLGVTLYEMLALRRAFEQSDTDALRSAILDARVKPLRSLRPEVPRDLATVVSVAMAPEPEHRYASAADLARDLTHVLEGEPIEARRSGPWRQIARVFQRSPVTATLTLLLVFVAPSVFAWQQWALARRIRAQRDRADASIARAREAVDYLVQVSERHVTSSAVLDPADAQAFEKAASFYEALQTLAGDDPRLRLQDVRNRTRAASLLVHLGRTEESAAALERAIAMLEALDERSRRQSDVLDILSSSYVTLGHVLMRKGDLARAQSLVEHGLGIKRQQASQAPDVPRILHELGWSLWHLGNVLRRRGDLPAAEAALSECLSIERYLAGGCAGYSYSWDRVANTLGDLGRLLHVAGRLEEAERCQRESLSLLSEHYAELLSKPVPTVHAGGFTWREFAHARTSLGQVLVDLGRDAEAEAELRAAAATWREIVGKSAMIPEHTANLIATERALAELLAITGRTEEAERSAGHAVADAEQLSKGFPDSPEYAELSARSRATLARILGARSQADAALEQWRAAVAAAERALAQSPEQPQLLHLLSECRAQLQASGHGAPPAPAARSGSTR